MSSTQGGRGSIQPGSGPNRFVNKNLNVAAKQATGQQTQQVRGNMLFIQQTKASQPNKTITSVAATAPTPLNTPSLRKENKGKDVNVAIVPTGNLSVWGGPSSQSNQQTPTTAPEVKPIESSQSTVPQAVRSTSAPWAKLSDNSVRQSTTKKNWADEESDDEPDTTQTRPRLVPTSQLIEDSQKTIQLRQALLQSSPENYSQGLDQNDLHQSGPGRNHSTFGQAHPVSTNFSREREQRDFRGRPPYHRQSEDRDTDRDERNRDWNPRGGPTHTRNGSEGTGQDIRFRERNDNRDYDKDPDSRPFEKDLDRVRPVQHEESAWTRGASLPPPSAVPERMGPNSGEDMSESRPSAPFVRPSQGFRDDNGPSGKYYSRFRDDPGSDFLPPSDRDREHRRPGNYGGGYSDSGLGRRPYGSDSYGSRPSYQGRADSGFVSGPRRLHSFNRGNSDQQRDTIENDDRDERTAQVEAEDDDGATAIEAARKERVRIARLKEQQEELENLREQRLSREKELQQQRESENELDQLQLASQSTFIRYQDESEYTLQRSSFGNSDRRNYDGRPNRPSEFNNNRGFNQNLGRIRDRDRYTDHRDRDRDRVRESANRLQGFNFGNSSVSDQPACENVIRQENDTRESGEQATEVKPPQPVNIQSRPVDPNKPFSSLFQNSESNVLSLNQLPQTLPTQILVKPLSLSAIMAQEELNLRDSNIKKKMLYDPSKNKLVGEYDEAEPRQNAKTLSSIRRVHELSSDRDRHRLPKQSKDYEISRFTREESRPAHSELVYERKRVVTQEETWKRGVTVPQSSRRRQVSDGDDEDEDEDDEAEYEDIDDEEEDGDGNRPRYSRRDPVDESRSLRSSYDKDIVARERSYRRRDEDRAESHETHEKTPREIEIDENKAAREKERNGRKPRTHGWLFKYNEAGDVIQVLADGEAGCYELVLDISGDTHRPQYRDRDTRDSKDARDSRDTRDSRDIRDTRVTRDNNDTRDSRDTRDIRERDFLRKVERRSQAQEHAAFAKPLEPKTQAWLQRDFTFQALGVAVSKSSSEAPTKNENSRRTKEVYEYDEEVEEEDEGEFIRKSKDRKSRSNPTDRVVKVALPVVSVAIGGRGNKRELPADKDRKEPRAKSERNRGGRGFKTEPKGNFDGLDLTGLGLSPSVKKSDAADRLLNASNENIGVTLVAFPSLESNIGPDNHHLRDSILSELDPIKPDGNRANNSDDNENDDDNEFNDENDDDDRRPRSSRLRRGGASLRGRSVGRGGGRGREAAVKTIGRSKPRENREQRSEGCAADADAGDSSNLKPTRVSRHIPRGAESRSGPNDIRSGGAIDGDWRDTKVLQDDLPSKERASPDRRDSSGRGRGSGRRSGRGEGRGDGRGEIRGAQSGRGRVEGSRSKSSPPAQPLEAIQAAT